MCSGEPEPIRNIMENMSSDRTKKLQETLAVIGCILTELVGTTPISEEILSQSLTMATGIPKDRIQEIFTESKKTYKES